MDKKTTYIIFALLLLLACLSAFNLFSGKNVSNNGNTVDAVGTNIQSAGNELDTISNGIDNAQSTSQAIEQSANRIEAINGSSAELIAKCKQITRDIRARDQSGTQASKD